MATQTALTIGEIRGLLQKDNPVILELGANRGDDSARFLKEFPRCRLYCFEPDPRAIKRWRARINDPRAVLVEAAIGASDGATIFHMSDGREDSGYPEGWFHSGSIRAPKNHRTRWPWVRFDRKIEVQVMRLDTWCAENGMDELDFIWADVQGAEGDVIEGGQATLSRTDFFYTEYLENEAYEGQPPLAEITRSLKPLGFVLERKFKMDALFRRIKPS